MNHVTLAASAAAVMLAASSTGAQTIKFSDIDCAQSEIGIMRYTKCGRSNYYSGNAQGGSASGQFYDQYAGYAGTSELVWVVLQRSRATGESFVYSSESRDQILMAPAIEVAQRGTNFTGTRRVAGGHIKTFTMPGWTCFSFMKDAPYKGGGIEYAVHGYSCGKDTRWHSDGYVAQFLAAIVIKPAR